ncbi:recombinase family protein [Vagococcus intermedius]|uniref:Recombinase family protein n=1 Tax=Vagococcus intermedius TaxID=2991418 RepID=A0AAF0I625_9ENTE|nr:recombinase family protein [Vagococcus intermedius]WEG72435.1 recombinase family protein [Vagococcus intermedius]WEG74522.1 recombinase family protein [Vagococcus intermedius]
MTKIGYARVSSKEQNLERQFELLERAQVTKIFLDKLSGKDNNRPQLKEMLNYIREDDIIVAAELDRLGRNNKEVTSVMNQIQDKGATLEILNLPSLSGIQNDNLRRLLNNLIIELFKYTAENERKQIRERQRQGIELAKEKDKYKGRPLAYSSDSTDKQKRLTYEKIVEMLEKDVPITHISKELDVARNTIYRIRDEK